MNYVLEVFYKSGISFKVMATDPLMLIEEFTIRVRANELENNVDHWTVMPYVP